MRQRGMTLIELVIAVAIVVLIAAASWTLLQGAQPFGMRSATQQFDAAVAYAQTLASSSGNGATMVFAQRVSAPGSSLPGFALTVYSGRPTSVGALRLAQLAPIVSIGEVREAKLGSVPFTIFLNSAGHASGMTGIVHTGSVIAGDPGCPSGETSIVLTFSDPRASDTRTIACNGVVAGSPVPIGTVAPEPSGSSAPGFTPAPSSTPAPTAQPTQTPTPVPSVSQAPSPSPTPVTPSPSPTPFSATCNPSSPCVYLDAGGPAGSSSDCQVGLLQCQAMYDWGIENSDGSTNTSLDVNQCCFADSDSNGNVPPKIPNDGMNAAQTNGTCYANLGRFGAEYQRANGSGTSSSVNYFWFVLVPPGTTGSSGMTIQQYANQVATGYGTNASGPGC